MVTKSTLIKRTRERVLDAALGVLHEQGFQGLTQPQVCRAAGITQGHLTYYFPTRSDLLLAVAEHSIVNALGELRNVRQPERGGQVLETLAGTLGKLLTDKDRPRMLLGLIVASDSDRKIKKPLREFIGHARRIVAGLFAELSVESDPQKITLLHASLIGLAILNFALDDPKFSRQMPELTRELLKLWKDHG